MRVPQIDVLNARGAQLQSAHDTLKCCQTPLDVAMMTKRCSRCGEFGHIDHERLLTQPILAYYSTGGRHRYAVDVWICDVCISEIRNHADCKSHSLKTTDQTESKKRDEDVQTHETL